MNLLYILPWLILLVLYVWAAYNIPILLAGVKTHATCRKDKRSKELSERLPTVSIIVPVKNEDKVISRLLKALLQLSYPSECMEIIIVEDGSTDRTVEICREYAEHYPNRVMLICQLVSDGKPSALNEGLKHAKGEIVVVFDADSVPESGTLLKAAKYFNDSAVAAIQGRIHSINADQNILTKFVSYEETIAFDVYLKGRAAFGLFIPFTGSCYFIRRSVIEEVGGWNNKSLSEDLEISVKLALMKYKTEYAPDVESWQESSANLAQLIIQRIRWFRGSMETGLKFGELATRLNRRNVDIELTLTGSFIFPVCFLGFVMTLYGYLFPFQQDALLGVLSLFTQLLTLIVLLTTGIALVYATEQRRIMNLLWLPFVYAYWVVESFIATYALAQIIVRRPRKWAKTKKTGVVANSVSDALHKFCSGSLIGNSCHFRFLR